jgi:RNA polymerase sigma-70 factor (ECF subfamily)
VQRAADAELEELWHACHRQVLAYALRRSDPETAEEVVAETFVVAWRRLDRIPEAPLPWLLAVARRVLANQRRAARRRGALVERMTVEASTRTGDGPDEVSALTALAELSERDREALLLHAWEGLDNRQAATVMGCSVSAYSVRLHRARRRFARALERADAETARALEVTP